MFIKRSLCFTYDQIIFDSTVLGGHLLDGSDKKLDVG